MWLLLSAILLQGLDAQSSCSNIAHNYKEINPLMGSSCASVVSRKSLSFIPYLFMGNNSLSKKYSVALIVSGGIGFTVNVAIR